MIKIVTAEGVSLDLAPDAEFVIEYNNPMMEDDRIPVPFSTDIALLPSATNCKTLRYLPAFKLEPAVRELAVSLILDGIPFLSGTLSYNGIEDGRLNYTFAGKDISSDWEKKLYDLEIMQYNILDDGTKEVNDGVFFPVLVDKDYTGYFVKPNDAISSDSDNAYFVPKAEADCKYGKTIIVGTPSLTQMSAISVLHIIPDTLTFEHSLYDFINNMAVIAPYKESVLKDSGKTYTDPSSGRVSPIYNANVAPRLPEMTVSEFVAEFMKIFCAAVFQDGDSLALWSFGEISTLAASGDWTEKIADEFSSEVEPATGYVFGYDNSGESSANITEYEEVDSVAEALYVTDGIDSDHNPVVNLKTARIKTTGDYISNQGSYLYCYYKSLSTDKKWALVAAADILFQNNLKQTNAVEGKDSTENICGFNLVQCVPSIINRSLVYQLSSTSRVTASGMGTPSFASAPVIDFPNKEADRGSDVHIGLMVNSQLTDSGRAMPGTVPDLSLNSDGQPVVADKDALADVTLTPDGWDEPVSLRPDWLYEHFHKSYAEWLAKDRQLLSCDVNLDVFDLVNFRMYHKVLIHGREFFVKKLSVTLRADSRAMECSAEFISA